MAPSTEKSTTLAVPTTLQAPNLRHLLLSGFTLPIGSRLLTAAVGLDLDMYHPSAYFQLTVLLH